MGKTPLPSEARGKLSDLAKKIVLGNMGDRRIDDKSFTEYQALIREYRLKGYDVSGPEVYAEDVQKIPERQKNANLKTRILRKK